jgi:hypothetical protein
MAYLGRVELKDFLSPNHPFAHDQISFVPQAQPKPCLPIGRHGITGWVSWGYERHDFKIGYARWRLIRAGKAVMVRSTGWYEGKSFQCRWYFDLKEECSLVVDYGDDGGQGFVGQIYDAHIEENEPRKLRKC